MNAVHRLTLIVLGLASAAFLAACGSSGGGGSAPAIPPWTKLIGTAGAGTVGNGVATDPNGNVYVTGLTTGGLDGNTRMGTQDFFVTMYDSAGNKVRTRQLGVSGLITVAHSVAVDSRGNVYVAGNTQGGLDGNTLIGIKDAFVTMYDSSGNKVRTRQIGASGQATAAASVAVDSSGNVYVAGSTSGGLDGNPLTGSIDFFVTMYDAAGNKVRTRQLGVPLQQTTGVSVAVDSNGKVYVAGYTTGGLDGNTLMGTKDIFVTTYDASGNKIRTRQLGVAAQQTTVFGVAVDSSGNVYLAGETYGGLDGNILMGTKDSFVTMYDASGNKIRTRQLGVSGGNGTGATGVAVDSAHNVYVSGYTDGGLDGNTLTGTEDLFVTTYDAAGTKIRTRQFGASETYAYATPAGIALDSNRNLYVAGTTNGGLDGNTLLGSTDAFLVKYDSSGTRQ
jgi:hypothetical protein